MFCTPELAARIDRAEARLCTAIARQRGAEDATVSVAVATVGGGAAIFGGADSPTNKLIGVGFDDAVTDDVLAGVEGHFRTHDARLQAEVSTLASPALHERLTSRGYAPSGFENVLGHPLREIAEAPSHIEVVQIVPEQIAMLADVLTDAWATLDTGGVGGDAIPPLDVIRQWTAMTLRAGGFRGYLARVGGEPAGGATLRLDDDGVAQFSGAATLPRFRRRGVQTALLRIRLTEAARAGCDVGVVVTQPASKSQQNVQREGFSLLYARQLLVKSP